MTAELKRLLRAARQAEAEPPALADILLARPPAPARLRAAPALAAVGALVVAVVVLVGAQPRQHAPAAWAARSPPPPTDWLAEPLAAEDFRAAPWSGPALLMAPPSDDWLAEPVGANSLRSVPSLSFLGGDDVDL
jgi:hypothetical protein